MLPEILHCVGNSLVEAERSLGITVRRKWGGHGGQPRVGENLPDGQLLGGCGPALLSLWEERGCEHTLKVFTRSVEFPCEYLLLTQLLCGS